MLFQASSGNCPPRRSTSLLLQHPSFRPGSREASERQRMADHFLELSSEEKREVLAIASDRSKRPVHLLEKDVWVVWALRTLYATALGKSLVFKGGTSLSKAYGAIRRFSEDVDLTYDIRALAPDLVGDSEEALPKTRSEEKRWSSEVRRRLPMWVSDTVAPIIAAELESQSRRSARDGKPSKKTTPGWWRTVSFSMTPRRSTICSSGVLPSVARQTSQADSCLEVLRWQDATCRERNSSHWYGNARPARSLISKASPTSQSEALRENAGSQASRG